MPKATLPFSLPDEVITSLEAMLSKGVHASRELARARILLKLCQCLGPAQVAREVQVHENTVYYRVKVLI